MRLIPSNLDEILRMRFIPFNSDEILIKRIWKVNLFLLYVVDSFFLLYATKIENLLEFLAQN
jgi:hypothetical protein